MFIETLLQRSERYNVNEHFATYITWNVYTDQLATSTKAVGYTFKFLLIIIILIKVLTLIVICNTLALHHLINIIVIESDVSSGNCGSKTSQSFPSTDQFNKTFTGVIYKRAHCFSI